MPESLFNKVAGDACNFVKKDSPSQVFSCKFCEIFKNTNFNRTPPVPAFDDQIFIIQTHVNFCV